MNVFTGSLEEFHNERNKLNERFGINSIHAGCYLCNYGDRWLCNEREDGMGCRHLGQCEEMYDVHLLEKYFEGNIVRQMRGDTE